MTPRGSREQGDMRTHDRQQAEPRGTTTQHDQPASSAGLRAEYLQGAEWQAFKEREK